MKKFTHYNTILNKIENEEDRSVKVTLKKSLNIEPIPNNIFDDYLRRIAKIQLVWEDKKVLYTPSILSVRETDADLFQFIQFITRFASRSSLFNRTSSKENALNYCSLVPVVLAAHKKFNNVPYQVWNHEKNNTLYTLGASLDQALQQYKTMTYTEEDLAQARIDALYHAAAKGGEGRTYAAHAWPLHTIELGGVRLPGGSLVRHILLQTWNANIAKRTPYMILDLDDWDNIPEALDQEFGGIEPEKCEDTPRDPDLW